MIGSSSDLPTPQNDKGTTIGPHAVKRSGKMLGCRDQNRIAWLMPTTLIVGYRPVSLDILVPQHSVPDLNCAVLFTLNWYQCVTRALFSAGAAFKDVIFLVGSGGRVRPVSGCSADLVRDQRTQPPIYLSLSGLPIGGPVSILHVVEQWLYIQRTIKGDLLKQCPLIT